MADLPGLNGGYAFTPPDTMGAIGPDHFVEMTNGTVSIWNKSSGTLAVPKVSLTNFWTSKGITGLSVAGSGTGTTDPHVIFDPGSDRWYAVTIDLPASGANRYLIAKSNTNDPTGTWTAFAYTNPAANFADYPLIGMDPNYLYVTTNNFSLSTGASVDTNFFRVDKSNFSAAGISGAFNINPNSTGYSANPIMDFFTVPADATKHISISRFNSSNLAIATLSGNTIGSTQFVSKSTTAPPQAMQPGGPNTIDTSNGRFAGATYRVGNNIWAVHAISIGGRAGLQWYRFDATNLAAAPETGQIADANHDFYYGAICANTNGDAVIGYTRSGSTEAASTYVSVGKFNGTSTTFAAPQLTKAGSGPYNVTFGGTRNRWGDYSQTTQDPNDPGTFWTVQEFSDSATIFTNNPGNWQTQITQVGIAPTLQSVTSTTSNGTYGVGATIDVKIDFDLPVTVSGTPQLALNSGGTAIYVSGSGTNSLTFSYTVAAGQQSADLDYTSINALTGGTISNKSVTSVLANTTLPTPGSAGSLGANKNIVIEAIVPTVVSYKVLFGSKSYDLVGSSRVILPWQITGIQVVFSEPIASGNANSLTGLSNTGFSGLGTNTLTWTITSLTSGNFATDLLGSGANAIKDAVGNALTDGAGFTQNFKVLYGDFNQDGVVTSADMVGVNIAIVSSYNIFADINGDGVVDLNDVQVVRTRNGKKLV